MNYQKQTSLYVPTPIGNVQFVQVDVYLHTGQQPAITADTVIGSPLSGTLELKLNPVYTLKLELEDINLYNTFSADTVRDHLAELLGINANGIALKWADQIFQFEGETYTFDIQISQRMMAECGHKFK
jgi:hypothetical protein